jgi:hypothetical protein
MKGALAEQPFAGPVDLDSIQAFLNEIQRCDLEHVFHDWTEWAQYLLDNDGDYVHE